MQKLFLYLLFLSSSTLFLAQEDKELYIEDETTEEEKTPVSTADKEIGVDFNFFASNFSGSAGGSLKLAIIRDENWAFGPSIRYQRSWFNNLGQRWGYNIYGPGFFLHYRFIGWMFLGGELEAHYTPFNNGFIQAKRSWVPTLLVGGGFSRQITDDVRINGGIMYDIIDHKNSPFAQGYFMKKENGAFIPIVYRIAFFIGI